MKLVLLLQDHPKEIRREKRKSPEKTVVERKIETETVKEKEIENANGNGNGKEKESARESVTEKTARKAEAEVGVRESHITNEEDHLLHPAMKNVITVKADKAQEEITLNFTRFIRQVNNGQKMAAKIKI